LNPTPPNISNTASIANPTLHLPHSNNISNSISNVIIPSLNIGNPIVSLQNQSLNSQTLATSATAPSGSSSSSPLIQSKGSFDEEKEKRHRSGLNLDSKVFLVEEKKSKEKRQPLILEESNERYVGILKFFDENRAYGFIIMENNSEIFVHYDDFEKKDQGGITKEFLASYKYGNIIKVEFSLMKYIGRYNVSRKAVEVRVIGE
jgi:'Cold-shock' DNA-binding domain